MRILMSVAWLGLMLGGAAAGRAAEDLNTAPTFLGDTWALRKHYTFSLRQGSLDYAEDKGEWRIFSDKQIVLSNTSFSITLGDGRVLGPANFTDGECAREKFTSPLGDGTHFTVTMPPAENLQVIHRLTKFDKSPFMLVELTLVNVGPAPVVVKEMNPVVIGPGGLALGAPSVAPLPLTARDGFLAVDPLAKPLYVFAADGAGKTGIGLGILPQGRASAGIDLQPSGGAWQGMIYNRFDPGLSLAPNERVTTDAVWISYALPDRTESNVYYSYTLGTNPHQQLSRPAPAAWVTVEEGEGLADLLTAAQDAQGAGIKAALIPVDWETHAGALEGAAPRYPRQITAAARQLKDAGVAAGLSLDPLAFTGGRGAWAAKSPDGQTWLNLSQPEARALVEERVRSLQQDGFDFFVVALSTIPDEVLLEFNLSRAAADSLAIQTAATAAGGVPVFPSAAAGLAAGDERWAATQAGLQKMGEYGALFAPYRGHPRGVEGMAGACGTVGPAARRLAQPVADSIPAGAVVARNNGVSGSVRPPCRTLRDKGRNISCEPLEAGSSELHEDRSRHGQRGAICGSAARVCEAWLRRSCAPEWLS
ncbi:MAG: hypothetical protein HYV26_16360 [Candidatus Hydrogenedentes bacterium]|nr:hypothetical protein [Candidatus Hydrogenedentota bacterium]